MTPKGKSVWENEDWHTDLIWTAVIILTAAVLAWALT